MKTLYLNGNEIGEEGAKALVRSARQRGADLLGRGLQNGLTEEAALSIVRVQRQRNKPTSLGLALAAISAQLSP